MMMKAYDPSKTYDWNYDHPPGAPMAGEEPLVRGDWNYCGLPTKSPLGIAAGPLLNGAWILYYASLGFDVLTYKTVRSRHRDCYPMPNLQPVGGGSVHDSKRVLPTVDKMDASWAVSFGMPSKDPAVWRTDIERTRRALAADKVLSVSIVATPEPNWRLRELVDDFSRCARWAIESGADCVEANFSCPNVSSVDGQIYHNPGHAAEVAHQIKEAIGKRPLLLKIGQVTDAERATALCRAVAPHVDALVMVNCIAARVSDGGTDRFLFDGEPRGIAGAAIREATLNQIQLFGRIIRKEGLKLKLVGVGGIESAEHVRAHIAAGTHAVQLATAAMLDPEVGLTIRRNLSKGLVE